MDVRAPLRREYDPATNTPANTVRGTIGLAQAARTAFAVVFLPLAAFGHVQTVGTVPQHTFVHAMVGVQGTVQFPITVVMVYLRYGGFPLM